MAQAFTQQVSISMAKGLITEATPLTFPEDATIDELNCFIQRDGARRRRLGFKAEDFGITKSVTANPSFAYNSYLWSNVGGVSGLDYVVLQIGGMLYFFVRSSEPLSLGEVAYSVDLTDYEISGADASTELVSVASVKGALVVCSSAIDSFYIVYDSANDTYTEEVIDFFIRDFEWLGYHKDYFKDDDDPSMERIYDTLNTGWFGIPSDVTLVETGKTDSAFIVDAGGTKTEVEQKAPKIPLSTYVTDKNAWPRLTHAWFSGKDSNDAFSVSEWEKVFRGTSIIVNGHFILNLYSMDRDAASNVEGINAVTPSKLGPETNRFSYVTTYAGRCFYTGLISSRSSSRIYFSGLIEDIKDIGNCYQVNDPTSETISDLLDTDGGYITIADATNIRALHVFGSKLLVFADNGVWSIGGVDDVFRATEFVVEKISEFGIAYQTSLVSASGRPYWWSNVGIHTVVMNELKAIVEQNISLPTIQTFWNNIATTGRASVTGGYDVINNRVIWLYGDETQPGYLRKNVLILDEKQGGFYPWVISCTDDTPWLIGVIPASNNTDEGLTEKVKYATLTKNGDLGFAEEADVTFKDWGTEDYQSYAETGYRFSGDLSLQKNAPFITVYLQNTAEGYSLVDGELTPIRPSSCLVSTRWNFSNTTSMNPQQAFILKDSPTGSGGTDLPMRSSIISTRLKCRGRGKVLTVRFESESGKDFCLIGFETIDAKTTRP